MCVCVCVCVCVFVSENYLDLMGNAEKLGGWVSGWGVEGGEVMNLPLLECVSVSVCGLTGRYVS